MALPCINPVRTGRLPDWEVPNLLTKYATIVKAYELSRLFCDTVEGWSRQTDGKQLRSKLGLLILAPQSG